MQELKNITPAVVRWVSFFAWSKHIFPQQKSYFPPLCEIDRASSVVERWSWFRQRSSVYSRTIKTYNLKNVVAFTNEQNTPFEYIYPFILLKHNGKPWRNFFRNYEWTLAYLRYFLHKGRSRPKPVVCFEWVESHHILCIHRWFDHRNLFLDRFFRLFNDLQLINLRSLSNTDSSQNIKKRK